MNDNKLICILKKYFHFEFSEDIKNNGNVWGRLVSIQSVEDYDFDRWDTTAMVNMVDNQEDFEYLKNIFKNN